MAMLEQWKGFKGKIWQEEINTRDFIQNNYTPYDGDESFLAGPADSTNKPDIVSRGFVYVRESEALLDEAKQLMKQVMDNCRDRNIREWGNIKSAMRDALSDYIYSKTKRSPMILPIIMEVQGKAD